MGELDGEVLRLEYPRDGVALLTLDRDSRRNALDESAQAELRRALADCEEGIRAVIITGSGTSFCAGIDLKERHAKTWAPPRRSRRADSWIETHRMIVEHPAICIAAVNGYALGGGVTLINSCDLAIAAHDAEIGMPEIGFGAYPSYSGASTQLRLLPKAAAWLILTGERIDGRRAAEIGLVNQSVEAEELLELSIGLGERIAALDPVALDWSKRALQEIPWGPETYLGALALGSHFDELIRNRSTKHQTALEGFGRREYLD